METQAINALLTIQAFIFFLALEILGCALLGFFFFIPSLRDSMGDSSVLGNFSIAVFLIGAVLVIFALLPTAITGIVVFPN